VLLRSGGVELCRKLSRRGSYQECAFIGSQLPGRIDLALQPGDHRGPGGVGLVASAHWAGPPGVGGDLGPQTSSSGALISAIYIGLTLFAFVFVAIALVDRWAGKRSSMPGWPG
jgi:hypothetical protein